MDNFNPKLTALALVLNVEENLEDIFRKIAYSAILFKSVGKALFELFFEIFSNARVAFEN